MPSNKLFATSGNFIFRIDPNTFTEEKSLENSPAIIYLTGDADYLWAATFEKLKKIDPTGNMSVLGTYILTLGNEPTGIDQSGDYVYITCLNNGSYALSPRVLKIKKDFSSESALVLPAVSGTSPNNIGNCKIDGSYLWVVGGQTGINRMGMVWKISLSSFTVVDSKGYNSEGCTRHYEDFKKFTEVDSYSHIDIPHHNYLDFEARRNEDCYLYKNYGSNTYFTNFTHKLKVECESGTSPSIGYFYLLLHSDYAVDDVYNLLNNHAAFIALRFERKADSTLCIGFEVNNTSDQHTYVEWTHAEFNTPYYIKIVRSSESSLYAYIYSDENYSVLVTTLSLDTKVCGADQWRYLFPCNVWNDASGDKPMILDVEDLNIGVWTEKPDSFLEIVSASDGYLYCIAEKSIIYKILKTNLGSYSTISPIPCSVMEDAVIKGAYYRDSGDLFFITGASALGYNYLWKLRCSSMGFERLLDIPDETWGYSYCSVGKDNKFYIGSSNNTLHKIKKIETIGDMSVEGTLTLSSGTLIFALWHS